MNTPAEWITAVASLVALGVAIQSARSARQASHSNDQLKLAIAQFENTFVDRLNGRYIRKPDNAEDYPVSRREIMLLEKGAKEEHERLDREIKLAHSRISSVRDAKPGHSEPAI